MHFIQKIVLKWLPHEGAVLAARETAGHAVVDGSEETTVVGWHHLPLQAGGGAGGLLCLQSLVPPLLLLLLFWPFLLLLLRQLEDELDGVAWPETRVRYGLVSVRNIQRLQDKTVKLWQGRAGQDLPWVGSLPGVVVRCPDHQGCREPPGSGRWASR